MSRLYEKFILRYYDTHFPELHPSASQIPWQVEGDFLEFLPSMQSDIMLSFNGKTLIIYAKYYSHTMQSYYKKHTYHSGNMYQIFTYVKNKDIGNTNQVSGMLLYAKTDEDITPDGVYTMSGNTIAVQTLDLNCDFSEIKKQLDSFPKQFGLVE